MPWRRGSSEEESRAYLQARLTTLFKLMFWCYVALMAFIAGAYWAYRNDTTWHIEPKYQSYVYAAFAVGVTVQAFVWRVVLLRRKLSLDQLHRLDAVFAISSNMIIAFCAFAAYDQRQSAYTCLIYTCWTVLTRALIVPSTGTRTAVVTSLAMTPFLIAVAWLTQHNGWTEPGKKDVPAQAMIVGYLQIATVAILLSAYGSRIIYGLQQTVSAVQQLGQYKLGRLLGEGGNGKVYLAHHVLLRRPTAIKLVPAAKVGVGSLERFEREVQFMSQLTHPNTVAVYDYGHSEGLFYYAMEYLGGGIDLQRLVDKHGPQPAERVRQILIQVCNALQEAHALSIIHRDIKPANIILCERGAIPDFVKVVDYGLVKEIAKDTGATTQIVLGTPAYIAPEAFTDPTNVGPGVDLYAIGCVAYFLLTGKRVFTGATDLDTCVQHVTRQPTPVSQLAPDVPASLEAVVMRCLAKTPEERHASAQALADALDELGTIGLWSEDEASAWWTKHRPSELPADATTPPTATITINIEERSEAA
jgi:eukaryotic-like serine/threonine-protein kinase